MKRRIIDTVRDIKVYMNPDFKNNSSRWVQFIFAKLVFEIVVTWKLKELEFYQKGKEKKVM